MFAEGAFGVVFLADERAVLDGADDVSKNVVKAEGREDDEIIVLVEADAEASDSFGHRSDGGFDARVRVDSDAAIIREPEVGASFVSNVEGEVDIGESGFDELDDGLFAFGAEVGFPVDDVTLFDVGIEGSVEVVISNDLGGPAGHNVIIRRNIKVAEAAQDGHEAFVECENLGENGDLVLERFVVADEFVHKDSIAWKREESNPR